MPELPEVETVRRGLARLVGVTVTDVEVRRAALRTQMPLQLAERLTGQSITTIDRRAKYLLFKLNSGETLLVHLGMSGRMVVADHDDGERGKHDHIVIHFADGQCLKFNDPRRFGQVDLFTTPPPFLNKLGMEPLEKSFTAKHLSEMLQGRTTAIKLALLDQSVVAGLGNIYVCEALFMAGIDPKRAANSLTKDECARLVPAIKSVLNAAIKAGGSSLRDYVQASGELGYFQHHFAVYGREGMPCPDCTCAQGVRRFAQGGRSTFWCAKKQV